CAEAVRATESPPGLPAKKIRTEFGSGSRQGLDAPLEAVLFRLNLSRTRASCRSTTSHSVRHRLPTSRPHRRDTRSFGERPRLRDQTTPRRGLIRNLDLVH